MFSDLSERESPRRRVFYTWDNEVRMDMTDPHGFIEVSYAKGGVPKELSGKYTTWDYAERDIRMKYRQQPDPSYSPE